MARDRTEIVGPRPARVPGAIQRAWPGVRRWRHAIARRARAAQLVALLLLVLVLVPGALPGCTTSRVGPGAAERADLPQRPPMDFSIDVTVLTGRRVPHQSGIHRQAGHAIVTADGTLWSGQGAAFGPDDRPAPVRHLTRDQMAGLWRGVLDSGLVPANASLPINDTLLAPGDGEIVTVATFTGLGDRWQFIWRNGFREPTPPPAEDLVRALAALAWETDDSQEPPRLPLRYDLGPDPYARYREAAAP